MTLDSVYLGHVLTPKGLDNAARRCRRIIEQHVDGDVDAVVFSGYSGALVAPLVAARMGLSPVFVRKVGEENHSSQLVEGERDVQRYVIVDDFVDSGETVRRLWEAMNEYRPSAELVAVVQYNQGVRPRDVALTFKDPLPGEPEWRRQPDRTVPAVSGKGRP